MSEWWGGLSFEQQLYYGVALLSTTIVFLQLALMMLGVGADELAEAGDFDMEGPEEHPSGLALVSSRTVFAFFVGFGWTGALAVSEGAGSLGAVFAATVVGLLFAAAIVRLMTFLHTLRHSGTMDYANAVGEIGTVYLEVHPGLAAGGQVQVMIQGRLRVVQALSRGEAPIAKGTRVNVVETMDTGTLVVEPVSTDQ